MNELYQQLNPSKPPIKSPINAQAMVNKLLQSNPKLQPYMDMIRNGANPKDMFYNLARQKGVDPNTFLSQLM